MYFELGHVKRCGIFLFFDKDGVVDEYIPQMLIDLHKSLDFLLVVCNGYVNPDGLKKLRQVSEDVICRANVGFDVGGYREGLFYLGWKHLEQYDEIVMLNYTIFAPIFPFKEMFDKMAQKDISFWGITKHHKVDPDPFHKIPYGYLPEHIQSHFLVLRRDLFMSYQYRDYICNMKNPENYVESICGYEAVFTKHFEDLGFKWDVYVETSEYEGYAYNPLMFYPTDMLKTKRSPIIKRRSFFTNYSDFLLNTCGESSAELYNYLRNDLHYNMNPIWDNLLRLENHAALHRCLHLNYVLESYNTLYNWNKKVILVLIVESTKRWKWYEKYLKAFPENIEIMVLGKKNDCDVLAERLTIYKKIRIVNNECLGYLEWLGYLVQELKHQSYDYVGVLRMMDVENCEKPYSDAVSWQYSDWDNLFYNKYVIENLLDAFEKNPRMGMCIPPVPNHGNLFVKKENGWWGKYNEVEQTLVEKGISVNMNPSESPLTPIGGSFWIRGSILKELGKYIAEKDEIRTLVSLPFLVQYMGFYTGIGFSDHFVSVEVTNADYMMRENNKVVFGKYGANVFPVVLERICTDNFENGEEV